MGKFQDWFQGWQKSSGLPWYNDPKKLKKHRQKCKKKNAIAGKSRRKNRMK